MAAEQIAIGIDLGGTRIKGVLVDKTGRVLHKQTHTTLDTGDRSPETGEIWKKAVYDMVQELKDMYQQKVLSIGLAAPGLPNETNNAIAYMPGRLQGLEQFNWAAFLDKKNTPVSVINDAQAALVAEYETGAGQGAENLIMLTLGTGVGGAVMINGKLYQGNLKRAGHFGHISVDATGLRGITGTPGSLEDAIGNATLSRRSLGVYESTQELVAAFKEGDYFAAYIWLESVRNLSVGIISLINAFSPEIIILGGGIAQADNALFEPLEQFLNKYEWRPGGFKTPIKKATFHTFSGAIGAAFFSLQQISN